MNSAGLEGARSATLQVRTLDATPPGAPVALAATAVSGSRIDLSWQAAPDPETGVGEYRVFRDDVEVGRTALTALADTGLVPSTSYAYTVLAVNGQGLVGPLAGPVTATTLDVTPPSAPTGLAGTAVSSTAIDLAWNPADDAESGIQGYEVYRDGARVGSTAATSFSDAGLAPNTGYSYTVRAVNGAGITGPSSVAVLVATLPDQTPPGVPGGLSAVPLSGTAITLAWTAAGDRRATSPGIASTATACWPTAPPAWATDAGLVPGTTYGYEVSAVNGAGLEPRARRSAPPPAAHHRRPAGDHRTTGTNLRRLRRAGGGRAWGCCSPSRRTAASRSGPHPAELLRAAAQRAHGNCTVAGPDAAHHRGHRRPAGRHHLHRDLPVTAHDDPALFPI
ncbi:MAG: fibronectin type III domain-containing protein [Gemmatimonadetes bacterium]|nr:fibronectin type III domain-containing protein [Gemmatimonadota bacterium]